MANVPWCGIDGEALVQTEQDPLVGNAIERYEIVERLGMGGMGCVYAAKHAVIDRDYAIKVLYGDFAGDEKFRARFKREAQSISKIRHPNIVQVEDFGTTSNGLTFLAMELVRGRTLEDVISTEAPMSPTRVAGIVRQVAAGLHAAHELGFVHRDVKPSNIMLLKTDVYDGEFVKILDFGAVSLRAIPVQERLTTIGHIIGTPAYMAPEQTQDPSVGPTADLYALGCVVYEMLSGSVPFTGNSRAEVMVQHITSPAPVAPPSRGLEHLVAKMMTKHPEDRPQSAAEVVHAIEALELGLMPMPGGVLPRLSSTAPRGLSSAQIDEDGFHSAPTNHTLLDGIDGPSEAELIAAARAERPTPPDVPVLTSDDAFPTLGADEHEEWGSTWGAAETVDPDSLHPEAHLVEDHRGTQPVALDDTGRNPVQSTWIVRDRETGKVDTSDLVVTPDIGVEAVVRPAIDAPTDSDMLYEPARPGDGPIVDEAGPTQVDFRMEPDVDPALLTINPDQLSAELGFDHRPQVVVGEKLDTSSVATEPPNDADDTMLPEDVDLPADVELPEDAIAPIVPGSPLPPVVALEPMAPPESLLPATRPVLDHDLAEETAPVPDDEDTADPMQPTVPTSVPSVPRLPQVRVSSDQGATADGAPAAYKPTSILPGMAPPPKKSSFYPIAIVVLLIVIAALGSLVYARYSAPQAPTAGDTARTAEVTDDS